MKKSLSPWLTVGLMIAASSAMAPAAAQAATPSTYKLAGTPTLYAAHGGGKTAGYVVFRTTGALPQSGSCIGTDACLVEVKVHGMSGRARHAIGSHCYRVALSGSSDALHAGNKYQVRFELRRSASAPLHTVATRELPAHHLSTGSRTPALSCSGSPSHSGTHASGSANAKQKALVGKRVHLASKLVVKAKPGVLYRGLLTKGTSIKIEKLSRSGKYAYGYAYGHVNNHDWVLTRDLLNAAA